MVRRLCHCLTVCMAEHRDDLIPSRRDQENKHCGLNDYDSVSVVTSLSKGHTTSIITATVDNHLHGVINRKILVPFIPHPHIKLTEYRPGPGGAGREALVHAQWNRKSWFKFSTVTIPREGLRFRGRRGDLLT